MSSKTWKGVEASGSSSSRNSARQQDKSSDAADGKTSVLNECCSYKPSH